MLDIEDLQKIKEKLFENKDTLKTESDFYDYLTDLELICANERSSKLSNLILILMAKSNIIANEDLLFRLYWLYFRQTYFLVSNIEKTRKILEGMKKISLKGRNIEFIAIVYAAESLIEQLFGNKQSAKNKITKAMETIENLQDKYSDTFIRILYIHTLFTAPSKSPYSETLKNFEKCYSYYSKSNNSFGLILVIYQLLRFYILSNQEERIEKLTYEIFQIEKFHNKLLDTHYVSLNWYFGVISIKYDLEEAIRYLMSAYNKIKENNLQKELLYEFTDIIKLLSRCFALSGEYQKSYNLLVELTNFMKTNEVRKNFIERNIKRIHFSSYNTLLFIFAQLELDITSLKDDKLKDIYDNTRELLVESKLVKHMLLETSLDDEEIEEIITDGTDEEIYLVLHHLLRTSEPYTTSEEALNKIQAIRDYVSDPLYVDISLGKIYLAMGKYEEFSKITEKIQLKLESTRTPILKLWIEVFSLIQKHILNPNDKKILSELNKLELYCVKNNLRKMEKEIKLYKNLILSSHAIEESKKRFQQSAFLDVFNEQSKNLVVEYLETKDIE